MRLRVSDRNLFAEAIPPSYKRRPPGSLIMYYADARSDDVPSAMLRVFPLNSSVVEIADVWVADHLRGQHAPGKRVKWSYLLLCAALRALKRRGFSTVWLWTVASNAPALRLYEKLGFHRAVDGERAHEHTSFQKRFSPTRLRTTHPWIRTDDVIVHLARGTCATCSRRCHG